MLPSEDFELPDEEAPPEDEPLSLMPDDSLRPDCDFPPLLIPDEVPRSSPARWQAVRPPEKSTGTIARASHCCSRLFICVFLIREIGHAYGCRKPLACAYFALPELLLPPLELPAEFPEVPAEVLPEVPPDDMPLPVSPPVDPPELLPIPV